MKLKKINHSYPKSAYICFFLSKNNGKDEIYAPHPEIVDTIEAVKSSVDSFNSTMKNQGNPISIWKTVGITRLELIDVFPYSDKKWNNPNRLIKNSEVGWSCYKLLGNDYFEYRVLIASCKDYKGKLWNNCVQSVYRSSSNKINWKTLLHSDYSIVEETKYIALYKCGPPEIYATDTGVVAELPPKGSEDNPKNIRRV